MASAQFLGEVTALVGAGRLADAEDACRRATAADPGDPQGWMALAEVRGLRGDPAGTMEAVRGAAWAAPADPDVLTACGGTALSLGHTRAGVRWLRTVLARGPHLPALRDLATVTRLLADRPAKRLAPRPLPATPPAAGPSLSVVVCSPDEARSAPAVAHWQALLAGQRGEIIPIIAPPSLPVGYGEGLARATGDAVVFVHDDVTLPPDAPARLAAHLAHADVVGLAGTTRLSGPGWVSSGWPYLRGQVVHVLADGRCSTSVFYPHHGLMGGIQALDGLLFAARRAVADDIGFDAATFDGFHLYDVDFSFRAHLAGYRVAVAGDIVALHASTGRYDAAWERAADAFVRTFADRLAPSLARTDSYLQVDFDTAAPALRFAGTLARLTPAPRG